MLPTIDAKLLFLNPMMTLAVLMFVGLWVLLVIICINKLGKLSFSERVKNKIRLAIKGAFSLIALSWIFFLIAAYMSLGWFAPWLTMVITTVVLGTAILIAGKGILYSHESTNREEEIT